jgi:hypothetical protein
VTSQNTGNISYAIPNGTTVTANPTSWNGVIAGPTATTVTIPDMTTDTGIEIGFSDGILSFDRAVRIVFPGQSGKRVGYIRTGISFTEITTTCTNDTQTTNDLMAANGDCKINVGSDLVVWTKHFTKFAVYHTTPVTLTSSGGGGGGYVPPTTKTTCTIGSKGDADGDCTVGILDFNTLMINWGKTGTSVVDFNSDNVVDILDFNTLMINWTK